MRTGIPPDLLLSGSYLSSDVYLCLFFFTWKALTRKMTTHVLLVFISSCIVVDLDSKLFVLMYVIW